MISQISGTIGDRNTKLGDNLTYCSTQLNCALQFVHASNRLLKTKKTHINRYFNAKIFGIGLCIDNHQSNKFCKLQSNRIKNTEVI